MASVTYGLTNGVSRPTGANVSISDGVTSNLTDWNPQTSQWIPANHQSYGPVEKFTLGNNPATAGLNNITQQATGGTINSFNTAANRLRERLDMQGRSMGKQATQQALGRGFGASGSLNREIGQINQGQQFAYGQGLSELANLFEGQRQQGLQTALGAQLGIGNQFMEGQGLLQKALESENTLNSDNFNKLQQRILDEIFKQNQFNADQDSMVNDTTLDKEKFISELKNKANIAEGSAEAAALGAIISLLGLEA